MKNVEQPNGSGDSHGPGCKFGPDPNFYVRLIGELICDQMIRETVVSLAHQGSRPGTRIILRFISEFSVMCFRWEKTFPSTTSHLR